MFNANEENNFFDIYFTNCYGTSAENVEKLANEFGDFIVFHALLDAKKEEASKHEIENHSYFNWNDLTTFERAQMLIIISELQKIYRRVNREEYKKGFGFNKEKQSSEEMPFKFAPGLYGSISLVIQIEVDSEKLEQIKEICRKADISVSLTK